MTSNRGGRWYNNMWWIVWVVFWVTFFAIITLGCSNTKTQLPPRSPMSSGEQAVKDLDSIRVMLGDIDSMLTGMMDRNARFFAEADSILGKYSNGRISQGGGDES